MGQCGSSIELPSAVAGCGGPVAEACKPSGVPEDEAPPGAEQAPPVLAKKGLSIRVDSVDDLLRELPCELDADLDHLYLLPECNASAGSSSLGPASEMPCFHRDVGVHCERAGGCCLQNQDNYALVQLDDLANPWGLYAVADGHGPQGHLISALLAYEMPGLLVQNPRLHSDSDLALYQSFVSAGEMAASCQLLDASISGSTLSAALLREGLLHLAWVGDSKAVLGRRAPRSFGDGAAAKSSGDGAAGGARDDVVSPRHKAAVAGCADGSDPPPSLQQPLRAVELTADHVAAVASGWRLAAAAIIDATPRGEMEAPAPVDAADGAGGPALAGPPRGLTRFFGNSSLLEKRRASSGSECGGSCSRPCTPEVRRLHIKHEDVFVILGTGGLWKALSPEEAVSVVGQHLHRTAAYAAGELAVQARRRHSPKDADADDLTAVVLYLAGGRHVRDAGPQGAGHGRRLRALLEARDHIAGWCAPESTVAPGHDGADPLH